MHVMPLRLLLDWLMYVTHLLWLLLHVMQLLLLFWLPDVLCSCDNCFHWQMYVLELWLLICLIDACYAVVIITLIDWCMLRSYIIIVIDWGSSARMFLWTDSLLRSFDCELAWWLGSDMEGIHVQQLLLWFTMIVTISMSHSYDLGTKSDFAMAMPGSNVIPLTVSIFLIRRT